MNRTFTGDGLGAFKTSVNRTIMVRLTFFYFFYLAPLSFSSFIIRSSPLLFLSPLIFLWACDGVGGVWTCRLRTLLTLSLPIIRGCLKWVRVRHSSKSESLCLVRQYRITPPLTGLHLLCTKSSNFAWW